MLPSESKYFGMAKGVLDRFCGDLETRYRFTNRAPTDAMLLRYAGLCLEVAYAEAGYLPWRFGSRLGLSGDRGALGNSGDGPAGDGVGGKAE